MKAKILSVRHGTQKGGKPRLYNIAVAGDESYVVEGLISHNCRCDETTFAEEDADLITSTMQGEGDEE